MSLTVEALTNCASYVSNAMTKSPFQNAGVMPVGSMTLGQFILFVIIYLALLYLIMWVGAFIFNASVVKVVPALKKASVLDFFGVYIISQMLFC